jgi:phosphoserine/homoserine phosphotransferase
MNNPIPAFFASDLEGVLIPEIWIAVAEKTRIEQLLLTTREIADYDALMKMRLRTLADNHLTIHDIHRVIDKLDPLPGAADFIRWVRQRGQFVIVTDSFYEFLEPFLPKLGFPTIFAHSLLVDEQGRLTNYRLRLEHGKRRAIESLRGLGFRLMAWGDSYNDTAMLNAADCGVLFSPPDNVTAEFPHFPVARTYDDLKGLVNDFLQA